jgi:hypothetical protein
MTREVVHYHRGQAPVRRPLTRLDVLKADTEEQDWEGTRVSEIWQGPEQELRARLRDEAWDHRVKPYGDVIPRAGLPRGWVAMRVYLTAEELKRPVPRRRPRKGWVIAGAVGAVLTGVGLLGYWVYLQLATAVAGLNVSALVGGGIVLALILAAAGGTTVVTVITRITIRRGLL